MSTDQQTLDGEAVAQPVELDDGRVQCHNCGEAFKRIGQHWSMSSTCSHPPLSEETHSIITGLAMGDGCIAKSEGRRPYLFVNMITKLFLEWLDSELGWFTTGVELNKTAEEVARNLNGRKINNTNRVTEVENCHDQYRLQTRSHPELQQYREWYGGGGIQYPADLVVGSLAVKMWYVSDGCMSWNTRSRNPYIRFTSANEQDTPGTIIRVIEEHGFDVTQSGVNFRLPTSQTEKFLDWLGEVPPGFAYKWETDDYEEYQRKKEEMV